MKRGGNGDGSIFDGAVHRVNDQILDAQDVVVEYVVAPDDDSSTSAGGKQNIDALLRVCSFPPQPQAVVRFILVLEVNPSCIWGYLYIVRGNGFSLADGNRRRLGQADSFFSC
jgi:hypothetical protein